MKGSNPEFAYQSMNFNIKGVTETLLDEKHLEEQKELLKDRIEQAKATKKQSEKWMSTIPTRMQWQVVVMI